MGFGKGEDLECNADNIKTIAGLWGLNSGLFEGDFVSKVVFSKWDVTAGTVTVTFDQMTTVPNVPFENVSGFVGLIEVKDVEGNTTNIKMKFNGVDVAVRFNDFTVFDADCKNLDKLIGGRQFKNVAAGDKFEFGADSIKIGGGTAVKLYVNGTPTDCSGFFAGFDVLSKAGIISMDSVDVKKHGGPSLENGDGIEAGALRFNKGEIAEGDMDNFAAMLNNFATRGILNGVTEVKRGGQDDKFVVLTKSDKGTVSLQVVS